MCMDDLCGFPLSIKLMIVLLCMIDSMLVPCMIDSILMVDSREDITIQSIIKPVLFGLALYTFTIRIADSKRFKLVSPSEMSFLCLVYLIMPLGYCLKIWRKLQASFGAVWLFSLNTRTHEIVDVVKLSKHRQQMLDYLHV